MNATELIRLSTQIENDITPEGDLIPKPGKEATIFSINQYQKGWLSYFHHELSSWVRDQIHTLSPERALSDHSAVKELLAWEMPCDHVFMGIGCYFAHLPQAEEYPDVIRQENDYAILIQGRRVSWAWTPDESDQAAELAVETLEEYRGRGFGRQVAAAWAAGVIEAGKIAFYSYRVDNYASARLARSLGVTQYTSSTSYSQSR